MTAMAGYRKACVRLSWVINCVVRKICLWYTDLRSVNMEKVFISLFQLLCPFVMIICYILQSVCGDHIFVMESTTCLRAILNCLMDHHGVLAYQPHLDQYENDTGCSISHLDIWLWAEGPFACTVYNATEKEQSTLGKYVSSTEQSMLLPAMQISEEKHKYICVTDGVMGKRPDLCDRAEIQVLLMQKEMNNFLTKIGYGIGAFLIIVLLVLFYLYKRRTREMPTSYLPNTTNKTETSQCSCESQFSEDGNDHHYTLPRTAPLKNVILVRPALRRTGDVRDGASEGNLHPLCYKYPVRSHRALSPKTSMSAPDLHIYENLKPYMCVTYPDESCGCARSKSRHDSNKKYSVHDYVEFFIKSGAASAPEIYAKSVPCVCGECPGTQCDCKNNRFKCIHVCQQNSSFVKVNDIDFHVISKSASAPGLDKGANLEP